ncbi:MAG: D-sedoheptulose 7-phosphate isomerase [Spirochaetes bacterium]|nr:D-sedoheptulose 7-phosphate isomerase [Spirochaetota bacterium]
MPDWIKDSLLESSGVFQKTADELPGEVQEISIKMAEAFKNGNKVMFCGNGGSAADSQHLATEFVVRLSSSLNRPALPGLALTTDTSMITACSNDYSFEDIFSRQIQALGKKGDILIGISTSGNSANIVKAFNECNKMGITNVLLSGKDGGLLKDIADYSLLVPSDNGMKIQEVHISLGHLLVEAVENILYKDKV